AATTGSGAAQPLLHLAGIVHIDVDDGEHPGVVTLGAGAGGGCRHGPYVGGQHGGGGGDVLPVQQPACPRPGARPRRPAGQSPCAAGGDGLCPAATALYLPARIADTVRFGGTDRGPMAADTGGRITDIRRCGTGEGGHARAPSIGAPCGAGRLIAIKPPCLLVYATDGISCFPFLILEYACLCLICSR